MTSSTFVNAETLAIRCSICRCKSLVAVNEVGNQIVRALDLGTAALDDGKGRDLLARGVRYLRGHLGRKVDRTAYLAREVANRRSRLRRRTCHVRHVVRRKFDFCRPLGLFAGDRPDITCALRVVADPVCVARSIAPRATSLATRAFFTSDCVSATTLSTSEATSSPADFDPDARRCNSPAITLNPRPDSPAQAASIPALSASSFARSAISEITSTCAEIACAVASARCSNRTTVSAKLAPTCWISVTSAATEAFPPSA